MSTELEVQYQIFSFKGTFRVPNKTEIQVFLNLHKTYTKTHQYNKCLSIYQYNEQLVRKTTWKQTHIQNYIYKNFISSSCQRPHNEQTKMKEQSRVGLAQQTTLSYISDLKGTSRQGSQVSYVTDFHRFRNPLSNI